MDTKIRRYIDKVINEHDNVSFHLDEPYQDVKLWNRNNMFSMGLQLFDDVVDELISLNVKGVMIQVQFPLVSRSKKIKLAPEGQPALISMLDTFSMPEIIIQVPDKKVWLPKLEMYFCPLPFKLEALRNNYHALYEQYREPGTDEETGDLVSWLTISYYEEE